MVPLGEARGKALVNRKLAREGRDPLVEKRRTEGIPTFAQAATRVLEQKQARWRNRKHTRKWLSSLRRADFPSIDKMPVSEATSADLLEISIPQGTTRQGISSGPEFLGLPEDLQHSLEPDLEAG